MVIIENMDNMHGEKLKKKQLISDIILRDIFPYCCHNEREGWNEIYIEWKI